MNQTHIDWLSFRTQGSLNDVVPALAEVYGLKVDVQHRNGGWMGHEHSADIKVGNMGVGMLAYGGTTMRGWMNVQITGRGCEWVSDWDNAVNVLKRLPDRQYKRADIALDTFHGESSHDKVMKAYRAREFAVRGRSPSLSQILPEDPVEGRTVYIGKRENGYYLRCYEKGLLWKKESMGELTHIDGIPVEDIYRVELEMKAVSGALPEDLIEKRDSYYAGAYPYLQSLVDAAPVRHSATRVKGPQMDLQAALAHIRLQYGPTLYTALVAYQGDVGKLLEKIVGTKHHEGLLAKGVLLVDHD